MQSDLTLEEVFQAYHDCRLGKRNTEQAIGFETYVEENLILLHEELINQTYIPGTSICFVVMRPKIREVWASNFRDRIVHHILYNRYSGQFHRSFIHDSYACIPGKGTLEAANRVQSFMRSQPTSAFAMKADVKNFFMSIDRDILANILARKIKDPWWFWLCKVILYHDPKADVEVRSSKVKLAKVPYQKSLFNAAPSRGLPIGNLSSQFFANIYLNELDQYVKHTLKVKQYARYVDDIVIIDTDVKRLYQLFKAMNNYITIYLRLHFHPNKLSMQSVTHGVNFVGYIIKPFYRYIRRSTVHQMYLKIYTTPTLRATINSYLGMLGHVQAYKIKLQLANHLSEYHFDARMTKML
jgi:hypothetical protein